MASLFRDLRLAFRALFRKPGLTLLAIASLGVAIGFSTAAFSVPDAYSLRELPVRDPRSLVWIFATGREHRPDQISWIEYQALSSRSHLFSGFLAQDRQGPRVRLPDRDDYPITSAVSDNFFDMLGVRPERGDVFHTGDTSDNTVVITDHYWQAALGGDPNVIGRTLPVGNAMLRITGVLPNGFGGTLRGVRSDLFVAPRTFFGALRLSRADAPRATDFEVIGRLRPGVSEEQARAEVTAILHQVEAEGRAPAPERKALLDDFTERSLGAKLESNAVLLAVALLLILIAAANLANLRLVDNEARRRETGIRLALGAGRGALARQHLAETGVLGGMGLAAGVAAAAVLLRMAPALFYGGRSYLDFGIQLDWRTFGFSCAALLVVVAIGGMVPLADSWKRSLGAAIEGTRTTRASGWLGVLVVAQMALVTAGACSAGLLLRSLQHLSALRPAMDPDARLLLVHGFWQGARDHTRTETLGSQMAGAPGVESVAWARRVMLAGSGGGAAVDVEMPKEPKYSFRYNQVSPSYFAVTGARVLSGRAFGAADGPDATPVTMVNAAFARRFFAGRAAVGQWVKVNGADHQIIGVVEDGPTIHLREPVEPYLYFAWAQRPSPDATFFVAAKRGGPGALADTLRPWLRRTAADFLALDMRTLGEHMRYARGDEQLAATVAGSLAGAGLLLAAAGLLGVTLFAVARRTREFGVRMAMGARPVDLAGQVLRQAAVRVAIALPLGWALAYAARHALEAKLYGVAPDDPATLAMASAVVAVVGALAALEPALRAARTDPMAALREE